MSRAIKHIEQKICLRGCNFHATLREQALQVDDIIHVDP